MKFSLTNDSRPLSSFVPGVDPDRTVYQIQAERDISTWGIKKGDRGGWVEQESNLDQNDSGWITDGVVLHGFALVKENAYVNGDIHIGGMCVIGKNCSLKGFIRLSGEHTLENIMADVTEWKALPNTKGSWIPHSNNHLVLKGKLLVEAGQTKWTAPGTVDGSLILRGKEVSVSGVLEVKASLVINDSTVGNLFAYDAVSIEDSYVVGHDGEHHLLNGKVVIRESSIYGIFYAEGGRYVLDRVINNGFTSLGSDKEGSLDFEDVQFYDLITIIKDSDERVLIKNNEFRGDLKLTTTEILEHISS